MLWKIALNRPSALSTGNWLGLPECVSRHSLNLKPAVGSEDVNLATLMV